MAKPRHYNAFCFNVETTDPQMSRSDQIVSNSSYSGALGLNRTMSILHYDRELSFLQVLQENEGTDFEIKPRPLHYDFFSIDYLLFSSSSPALQCDLHT